MKIEPATVMVVIVGSVTFFLLLLPLLIVLGKLPAIWKADRANGLLLVVIVVLTGFLFTLFFAGLLALVFS